MKFLRNLSDTMKGILILVGGIILLFNTLGIASETLDTVVLIGAIGMILLGIYISNAHQKIYMLLVKEKKKFDDSEEQH